MAAAGIGDRGVSVLRERIDDAHLGIDQRVGGVDDAQRHLAARNEHHGAADIVGTHQAILNLVPDAERDQRGARITPHGNGVGVARSQAPLAERSREVEPRRDLELDPAVGRRDQHQPVAHQVAACGLVDEIAGLQVVHPLLVGRDEHVGLAAGFDLARQHRAGGERQSSRYARGFLPESATTRRAHWSATRPRIPAAGLLVRSPTRRAEAQHSSTSRARNNVVMDLHPLNWFVPALYTAVYYEVAWRLS